MLKKTILLSLLASTFMFAETKTSMYPEKELLTITLKNKTIFNEYSKLLLKTHPSIQFKREKCTYVNNVNKKSYQVKKTIESKLKAEDKGLISLLDETTCLNNQYKKVLSINLDKLTDSEKEELSALFLKEKNDVKEIFAKYKKQNKNNFSYLGK